MRDIMLELVNRQQDTYKNIFSNPGFHNPNFHYDWWMFPVHVPLHINVSETTRKFAVNHQDIIDLLHHQPFINTYINSIEKYLNNLNQFGWNHYDIRYAKMLNSLTQFIKVAELLKHEPGMSDILNKLNALAHRALVYAQANIHNPSALLQQGYSSLSQISHHHATTPNRRNNR